MSASKKNTPLPLAAQIRCTLKKTKQKTSHKVSATRKSLSVR